MPRSREENLKELLRLRFHDDQKQQVIKPDQIQLKEEFFPEKRPLHSPICKRIKGSIFGLALGDALGAHVEFRPRTFLQANPVKDLQGGGTWGLDKGQFTDDTSMALCLANSLLVCEEFEPYDQLLRYKWWYRHGYMSSTGHCFDIGSATRQSIQQFEKRQKTFAANRQMNFEELEQFSNPDLLHEFDVFCSKEGVAGNGALMRLAPLPLFFFHQPKEAIEFAGISGQITHGDRKAYDACRYFAALIIGAMNDMKKTELLDETFYQTHREWFGEKDLHEDILKVAKGSFKKAGGYDEGIRGKGYIVDALQAALWAFHYDEDSFEKGVLLAVNLGDDTDTTAAIYGQLAGAYYTFEQLPKKWLDQIYAKDFLHFLSEWITVLGEKWAGKGSTISTSDITLLNLSTKKDSLEKSNESFYSHSNRLSIRRSASLPLTERKAVDELGHIGYFYNAIEEKILQGEKMQLEWKESLSPSNNEKLLWKKGNESECRNLLRLVAFSEEEQLSLLTDLLPRKGLATLLHYPFLLDQFTRVIFFSKSTREQSIVADLSILPPSFPPQSTHLITAVSYGIDLLILLRLPSQAIEQFDQLMEQFSPSPLTSLHLLKDPLLDGILSTYSYSNLPALNNLLSLREIFYVLSTYIDQSSAHWPLTYTLQPLVPFYSLERKVALEMEEVLLKFRSIGKIHQTTLDEELSETIRVELQEQLADIQRRLQRFEGQEQVQKERAKAFLLRVREKNWYENVLLFTPEESKQLDTDIDDFLFLLNNIRKKQQFLEELQKGGFLYWNVIHHHIEGKESLALIEGKLMQGEENALLLCSNDFFNFNHSALFEQLVQKLQAKQRSNPSLKLIYADFSYCSWELDGMVVLPEENPVYQRTPSQSSRPQRRERSLDSLPSFPEMNVLLFGKSGIGKSTLINNYINYLQYDSYEQFSFSGSPLRVIVSFVHLLPNISREHRFIQIGHCDSNENYEHSNEPTTQFCKLHSFLSKDGRDRINLIDTPGFGKGEGGDGDERIIDHILSRVINLSHLDAICILLPSDQTDFHAYQTALEKLLHLFDDREQKINLFFLFTRYLSHPISSEEQLRLVQNFIQVIPKGKILFARENLFTFDSTFFHQLSLFHHFQRFIHFENDLCEKSWQLSQKEWTRFLPSLRTHRRPFVLAASVQNKELYRLEIHQLIRPILEALRNTLRNDLLLRNRLSPSSIELLPVPTTTPSALCSKCKRTYQQCGPFWIAKENLHEYGQHCHLCQCSSAEHSIVDYRIDYRYVSDHRSPPLEISREILPGMLQLASFLLRADRREDLFLLYLDRMIEEERSILTSVSCNSINTDLHTHLRRLKQVYQERVTTLARTPTSQTDLNIDQIIEDFKQIPLIKIQFNAATRC